MLSVGSSALPLSLWSFTTYPDPLVLCIKATSSPGIQSSSSSLSSFPATLAPEHLILVRVMYVLIPNRPHSLPTPGALLLHLLYWANSLFLRKVLVSVQTSPPLESAPSTSLSGFCLCTSTRLEAA